MYQYTEAQQLHNYYCDNISYGVNNLNLLLYTTCIATLLLKTVYVAMYICATKMYVSRQ